MLYFSLTFWPPVCLHLVTFRLVTFRKLVEHDMGRRGMAEVKWCTMCVIRTGYGITCVTQLHFLLCCNYGFWVCARQPSKPSSHHQHRPYRWTGIVVWCSLYRQQNGDICLLGASANWMIDAVEDISYTIVPFVLVQLCRISHLEQGLWMANGHVLIVRALCWSSGQGQPWPL